MCFWLLGQCDCENPSAITKAQIAQWESEGIVKYLGFSSDVRGIIAQSSCIVLPSFYKEGVPRILLEAMSMGKPIITTNVSGCKECAKPPFENLKNFTLSANAILIPPKDSHTLYQACAYLAQKPLKALHLGQNAREYVIARFEISHIITHYKNALLSLVAQNAQRESTDSTQCQKISQSHQSQNVEYARKAEAKRDLSQRDDMINGIESTDSNKSQKPKLAFISNTTQGMLNFRLEVLIALQNMGYEIHILAPLFENSKNPKDTQDTTNTTSPQLNNAGKRLLEYDFNLHNIAIDSKGLNPLRDTKSMFEIYRLLRGLRPQMVFNYTIKPVIYGSFASNMLKIPNIAVITGLGYVFIGNGLKKRLLRTLVCGMYKIALKKTAQVWFLNPDDKAEFLARKIIAPNRAFLLDSEGVDTEFFHPNFKVESKEFKTESNADFSRDSKEPFIFLLAARMLWDKGVGEFVEAARMLKNELENTAANKGGGIEIRFYLLGALNAQNPSAITREQIAQWESEGVIKYLGFSSDVREIIAQSSCIVLPSYREGVPMSLLEAMSMGKPIITSNAPGCKEVVTQGYNGFLCDTKSAQSLYLAMRLMIALSKEQRAILGANSRKLATARYNKQKIIAHYKNALKTTLNKSP
ncbi:glycosyltransferase [Helicobacter sp. MIT 00-7814]|uniref:glycosyltransferase n=1 Tax=unclassified Helicobacter TaxID=2593540 RepID=UPI0038D2415C